ncbi:MAG: FHA domain-containing protein [Fuerstiella sp.]
MDILKRPSSARPTSTPSSTQPAGPAITGPDFSHEFNSSFKQYSKITGDHSVSQSDCEKRAEPRAADNKVSAADFNLEHKFTSQPTHCSLLMAGKASKFVRSTQSSNQDIFSRDDSAVAGSESETSDTRRFLLWIDGVGVWQLLMGNHFVIGAPSSKGPEADLAIQANVRKQHACVIAERDEWVLDPLADAYIANQRIAKRAHLQSGDQIRLGESVELGFRLPSPLSNSAVLDFESGHRPLQSVDGVILLTDHCIVGPRRDQHIYCSTWQHSFVLFRRDNKLLCRSSGDFQFNGTDIEDVCEIVEDSMIESEHCRFRIEVIQ